MSRRNTSKVKKNVMEGIAKLLPNSRIIGRKLIKTKDKLIKCWASRDYGRDKEKHNWYGIFNEELIDDPEKTVLLFTTEDEKNFMIIPLRKFLEEIKPYLRITSEGFFFLVVRKENNWLLPKDYIPKSLRAEIIGDGVGLNEYVNNLSYLGVSYSEYLKLFRSDNVKNAEIEDINLMIKLIAEKDPSFLAKSTEEKLIIIRYKQIMDN